MPRLRQRGSTTNAASVTGVLAPQFIDFDEGTEPGIHEGCTNPICI
jgi:hypothetical protein